MSVDEKQGPVAIVGDDEGPRVELYFPKEVPGVAKEGEVKKVLAFEDANDIPFDYYWRRKLQEGACEVKTIRTPPAKRKKKATVKKSDKPKGKE